jgi:type IV secretion system protein VirB10
MVLVIALSGGKGPQEKPTPAPATAVVDPNEAQIREYRERIEQQAQKLALEQTRLAHAKQSLAALPSGSPTSSAEGAGGVRSGNMAPPTGYTPSSMREPDRNWIEVDWEKRKHASRFSSNLALSYRNGQLPAGPLQAHKEAAVDDAASFEQPSNGSVAIQKPHGEQHRIFEGTFLETVLTNRLDGSFSGPVNCMVTTNVYSQDRRKLLIPQGSRVLGEISRVETFGQQRLAVTFHRLFLPNGY